eukprot:242015-Karenia_brevis.AAC.1
MVARMRQAEAAVAHPTECVKSCEGFMATTLNSPKRWTLNGLMMGANDEADNLDAAIAKDLLVVQRPALACN